MVINMNESRLRTLAQLAEFLKATADVDFSAPDVAGTDNEQRYAHISRVLARFDYPRLGKVDRGVVLAYLLGTSGFSRAQLGRLVARWRTNRVASVPLARRYRAPTVPFARKYNAADVALLVEMDQAHRDVCGPAIAALLGRAYLLYGDARYERLADLSVSHLYNLRKSAGYRAQRVQSKWLDTN